MITLITILYGMSGVIMISGYYPTLKDLFFHKKNSANVQAYSIWAVACLIGVLYGITVLHDWLYTVIMVVHVICCSTIAFMSWRMK